MFWGNFSFSRVRSLIPIEGMMNLYKYIDVIKRKVIPDMWRAFPDGGGKFRQVIPCVFRQSEDGFQETKIKVY